MPFELQNETLKWKPHERQEHFIQLPFSIFEALFGGAAGGGKSELLLMLPILYGFHNYRRFKGIFLRRTFRELEREIIPRSYEFYEPLGAEYNKSDHCWTFPERGLLFFGHAEEEKDIRKYDSDQYNYIAMDELTSFTEFQYLFMTHRARSGDVNLPAIVRAGTNPGNIGHAWVRKRFVEPNKEGNVIIRDKVTGTKRAFIKSLLTDNPYLMKNDPEYGNRLSVLPEAERKAKRDGDWWTFSGQMFSDFRSEKFADEPENALHVIDPFEIPAHWPRIIAGDWGTSAMTIFLWAAISPDNRIYVYREYACNGGKENYPHLDQDVKVSTWATNLALLSVGETYVDAVLDANAWDKRAESEDSIAELARQYSGIDFRRADKGAGSRIAGRVLLQELLRWKSKPKRTTDRPYDPELADKILRWRGEEEYRKYIESFKGEPDETNLPRIQFFKTCPEVIRVIPLLVRDQKNPEDTAEFPGDDPYDACRYLIRAISNLGKVSNKRDQKEIIKARVIDQASKDMHAFYMGMHRLDAKQKFGVRHRRRYH